MAKATNGKRTSQNKNSKSKKIKYENIREEDEKPNKNSLYSMPTVEELNQLKETENLYNNNLFRLQTDELLAEIQIKNKRKKALSSLLKELQTILNNLPEENYLLSKNKECPYKTDQDLHIKLLAPDAMETFGLYEINSLPGPDLICNLNLQIPKSCFNVRDYLNNRYLVKRWCYLHYIAKNLKKFPIKWNYHENNKLLPILTVNQNKVLVNIYPTPPEDYFKPARFLPNVNNMKINLFEEFHFENDELLKDFGTVYYNCAHLHDVTLNRNWNFIKKTLDEQKNVQDGLKILQVWLKQRELQPITQFCVYLTVYLFIKKRINGFMSSYQIVRNFWNFICTNELKTNLSSICNTNSISSDTLSQFQKYFDTILLDESGCFNVGSFIHNSIYVKLRKECEISLNLLDKSTISTFDSLFITKLPFQLQFDLILKINEPLKIDKFTLSDEEKAKFIGFEHLLLINCLLNLLQKGFNDRVVNIVPKLDDYENFTFGITLNPDKAFNFLELGPPLNELKEADEFRQFWGKLASNRRFRDGSAKVAVYFKTRTIQEKRAIVKKILQYILNDKLNINQYIIHYDEFEEFIMNKKIHAAYPLGTNEEASLKVVTTADDLGKKIRSLEMSLSVTGLNGVSDVFSYTDIFPPISTSYELGHLTTLNCNNFVFKNSKIGMVPRFVQTIDSVIQLEHSSKWPNDLQAVRHIKTLFYLEMSKLLESKFNIFSHTNKERLNVFYEGFVFRYKMFVPKEVALLKREVTTDGIVSFKDTKESFEVEKLNLYATVNGALKGIQSQFPSYGPGTALIKRWLRSQLIDDYHFPDKVVNLLNASLYLNSTAFDSSNTPQISFCRFLKFISDVEFDMQTILLNFNDELTKAEICEIENKLQQNRDAYPPLYIIMPYDKGESIFTKNAPTKCILKRVKELAKATLDFIQTRNTIKEIFIPNLAGYNVLIHLKPLMNPRRHEQCFGNENVSIIQLAPYNAERSTKIPIVDFNPIEIYMQELRESYGHFANFFHDPYGGDKIAVLWNPKAIQEKPFKVSYLNGRKAIDDKLIFNEDAIIEDFYVLGKDLVKLIEKC